MRKPRSVAEICNDLTKQLTVAYLPLSKLVPSERNARTHSQEQIKQIAASISAFGWTNPILIDEDRAIIAGHGRLEAAKAAGLVDVPTITLSGLSATQKRALAIADNKLALNAGWDDEMLRLELSELGLEGFDISLVGFSELELKDILADRTEGLTDPDDVPEVQADAVTVTGDVWTLGRHRLVCGDCTDAGVVEVAMAGVRPHLMVTDPPYGVEYDAEWRDSVLGGRVGGRATGRVTNDSTTDWRDAWSLFRGDIAYCWHAGLHASSTQQAFEACGFQMRSQIIWSKSHFAIGRGHYHVQHEPCFYLVREGATGHWVGDRKQTTLWQIDKPTKSETGHSTQKPVECMRRPIENNSSPGQAVYDPFSGSGTTIIAAEMTGRACHAIEISQQYCDVTIRRWQNFTGQTATLESDGRTFAAIETERGLSHAA